MGQYEFQQVFSYEKLYIILSTEAEKLGPSRTPKHNTLALWNASLSLHWRFHWHRSRFLLAYGTLTSMICIFKELHNSCRVLKIFFQSWSQQTQQSPRQAWVGACQCEWFPVKQQEGLTAWNPPPLTPTTDLKMKLNKVSVSLLNFKWVNKTQLLSDVALGSNDGNVFLTPVRNSPS